jgi:DMSO/TMAO reductase YedYZ molybdopterin-dependent catalytic subunit
MSTVSPGFRGRRGRPSAKLPPGQYLVEDFPVLSAGPTPRIDLDTWEFTITNETGERQRWSWDAFRALPSEAPTVDIHCVTKWSKLGTGWEGVSLDTLLGGVETSASFALAESYGVHLAQLQQDGGSRGGQGGPLPVGGHALQGNLVGVEREQA